MSERSEAAAPSTEPATVMRAATIRRYGTPPSVTIEDVERPVPGEGQVLVEVAATSLNALDWHLATGTPYLVRPSGGLRAPKRIIPGADVAGTVVEIGSGVDEFSIGDRVFGEIPGGGCARWAVARSRSIALVPDGVSDEAAAATPVAGLTALQGLVTKGELVAGERVLINGAAGGVGSFAVQLAAALGARVTGVCSTGNVEMVADLGAERVVDYTRDDLASSLEGPFDLILDNVGSLPPARMRALLTAGGRYVVVSGSKDDRWLGPARHLVRSLAAFALRPQTCRGFVASPNRPDLETLAAHLADGTLTPRIHQVIGLDEVETALRSIGGGHTPAKIVVRPA